MPYTANQRILGRTLPVVEEVMTTAFSTTVSRSPYSNESVPDAGAVSTEFKRRRGDSVGAVTT